MVTTLTAVDLFAGLGGNTEGARMAGVRVIRAANHCPIAVSAHERNHPEAEHDCQDLQQADFTKWPDFDILMASPACQGFSSARGTDRPHHDTCRSTAWAIVACAESKRPAALMVENVREFTSWSLFPAWKTCLETLGYTLHVNRLDAADFGVPQHRVRVFITGVHRSVSAEPVVVTAPRVPHVPAESIIDWAAERNWSSIHGKVPATVSRWENGRRAHGARFLMAYFGKENGGRSLARPMGSVTTRDRYAIVDGDRLRMLQAKEYLLAQGFRKDYQLTGRHKDDVRLVGNAVAPPVARAVVEALRDQLSYGTSP